MTWLTVTRGQTAAWNIPITLSGVANPLPEQAVLTWTAARRVGDEPIITKTSSDGILIIHPEDGQAQLQLDPSDTIALSGEHDTVLAWDLWLTIDSDQWSLATGSLTVHVGPRLFEDDE